MQHARERLYFTADRSRLVRAGDPKAAFLYAALGDEIPDSAAQKFGLVNGRLKAAPKGKADDNAETLLGSSTLPSIVVISDAKSVQLGEVVASAHQASGLTVDAWNALPGDQRDDLLKTTIEAMRAPQPATPPSPPAAPSRPRPPKPKKAAAGKAQEKPAGKEQAPPANKEQPSPENKGG